MNKLLAAAGPRDDADSGSTTWSAAAFSGGRPIIVLSPHPDDESLGCGALLAACFETSGAHIVCVTDGRRSHPNSTTWPGHRLARLRERELVAAVQAVGGGAGDVTFLRYRDCRAPRTRRGQAAAVGEIVAICDRLGAASVFATSPLDPHTDHQSTAAIACEIVAQRPGMKFFYYPVWSRWQCAPFQHCDGGVRQRVFRTKAWRDQKAAAIAAHRSQLGLVVRDDPDAFVLETGFVDRFVGEDEIFYDVDGRWQSR